MKKFLSKEVPFVGTSVADCLSAVATAMAACVLLFMVCAWPTDVNAKTNKFVTHCTVTTYNATSSQCGDKPAVTADGTKIVHAHVKSGKQRIAAVSRDLLWCLPYGSEIEIEGHGRYVVADTMNPRYNHYVDILIHDNNHFKKEKVKVTLVCKGPDKMASK